MAIDLSNLLVPAMIFFALGLCAQLIRSHLKFSSGLTKALTVYPLIGIRLHGGKKLAKIKFRARACRYDGHGRDGGATADPNLFHPAWGRTGRLNTLTIAVHDGLVSAGAILERSEPKRLSMLRELNLAETVVNPLFRYESVRCL